MGWFYFWQSRTNPQIHQDTPTLGKGIILMIDSTPDYNKLSVEKARKRLLELSLKSLGEIPQLVEPTHEQKIWVIRELRKGLHNGR